MTKTMKKIALIDIGSNTIRLVVYSIDSHYNFLELHNVKTPARLSQYIENKKKGQVLNQAGIDILIETLASYKQVIDEFQVEEILPKATAAIRQSNNQEDIIKQVQKATGLSLDIVSEEDEATLGAYAITHSTIISNAITIDIGGGSCEVTHFEDKQTKHYHSFPFGTVSLKRDFFQDKAHNDPEAIEAVRDYVKKAFKDQDWIKKAKLPIVAIGGSARNVANVLQRKKDYPMAGLHGFTMSEEDLEETLDLFIETNFDDMEDIDGLSSDRTDIIIPANLVFLELFAAVKATTFCISSMGLREGMIQKHINERYNYPIDNSMIRARSISLMKNSLPMHGIGSQAAIDTAISLYQQICRLGLLDYSYPTQELVELAACIYRFGSFISNEADSQHTFYITSNMNLLGFVHKDRLKLALLASYRNRSLFKQYLREFDGWLTEEEKKELEKLGGILKFNSTLNDSAIEQVTRLKLSQSKKGYTLTIYHKGAIIAEKYRANRHQKHLKRALDDDLTLVYQTIDD